MAEPSPESLCASGARPDDALRRRYLEALTARLPHQSPRVQQVLQDRLKRAMGAPTLSQRCVAEDAPAAATAAGPTPAQAHAPLAQLNRELEARARSLAEQARRRGTAGVSEMQSVQEFSDIWACIHAEQRVAQALGQGPENAGPLNPHRLILRSLGLMKELSPEYLGGFLSHAETLVWLEQANARPRSLGHPARGGKAGRSRAQER